MPCLIAQATDLTIAPLAKTDRKPRLVLFMFQDIDFRGTRRTTLDVDTSAPTFQPRFINEPTNFRVIDLLSATPRVLQLLLELTVVGQE